MPFASYSVLSLGLGPLVKPEGRTQRDRIGMGTPTAEKVEVG